METNPAVKFDGVDILSFVQGEDRAIAINLYDRNTNLPIDLTGSIVGLNMPLLTGGSVKRITSGPSVLASTIVIGGSSPGYINLVDHGLVTGDPIQLTVLSGGLPSPLAPSTPYLVKVIDVNSFYITDLSGNILSLTTQGTGSFKLVNTDLAIQVGDLGQVLLNLRSLVSAAVYEAQAQNFQFQFIIAGKTRIIPLIGLLDVFAQQSP